MIEEQVKIFVFNKESSPPLKTAHPQTNKYARISETICWTKFSENIFKYVYIRYVNKKIDNYNR